MGREYVGRHPGRVLVFVMLDFGNLMHSGCLMKKGDINARGRGRGIRNGERENEKGVLERLEKVTEPKTENRKAT